MTETCDICAQPKETAIYQLSLAFSDKPEKYEWKVCEDCVSAFNAMVDYAQGQR